MLIQADARAIPLRDGCVQCVVTSPPYWGLRDYGHGDQIGLEATPAAYVGHLVQVFAEVRRVLADDGVCWLNLGDSYAGSWGARGRGPETNAPRPDLEAKHGTVAANRRGFRPGSGRADGIVDERAQRNRNGLMAVEGCKAKDLVGIPWRVAFALQADGWYLRSDIIWSKPNPMPESVTDRPTKAHEYLFLLTKSERYYYDAQAIAEPVSAAMLQEVEQGYDGLGLKDYESAGVQNPSSVKARIIANAHKKEPTRGEGYGAAKGGFNGRTPDRDGGFSPSLHMQETPRNDGDRWRTVDGGVAPRGLGRNRRSVWTVATQAYHGSHFATMPEKLVEPCILAGSRFGDLVFDPFSGSGTVLAVAERLGRRGVGTDLNPAYHELAKKRTAQRGLRFVEEAAI